MSELEQLLLEILEKIAREQGYEGCQITSKAISSGGANYTSLLYLATISSPPKDDVKVFAKVAAVGEKMRTIAPFRIFETESFFYKVLMNKYAQIEERHLVPAEHRLMTPKFYGCNEEYLKEAVILEDMTARGFQTHDRFKSVDWEYASRSVQNLAKLHALSIALSVEDPEEFEKTASLKIDNGAEGLIEYMNTVTAQAIECTREENRERLKNFVEKMRSEQSFSRFYKPIRRPVIAHGDYRPSNLMHRVNDDGKTVEVISIDYQTLQQANPILDLLYFIYNGSDKQYRQTYLHQTFEHYYTELCAALKRLDLDSEQLYPREDFDYEFNECLPYGLMVSIMCLLIVTVEEDDAPKVSKDIALTDFAIAPSKLYKERINDIIDEYIQMGIL